MSGKNQSSVVVNPDMPLTTLTEQQKQFALFVAEGKSAETAARLAGFPQNGNGYEKKLLKNPKVQVAIRHMQKQYERSIVASRTQVLEGFLEAIEQAKVMSDPAVQIAGWREIGKMCGYYAPEVKEINVNIGAKRVISQLEVMSDDELLGLIEKDQQAIEGEVRHLTEEEQQRNDGVS